MASIVQDLQVIRSLRKELRDAVLPIDILNSIQSIHNCIKTGTDLNGWKKIDWRGSSSGQGTGRSSGGGGGGGGFFGNRHAGGGREGVDSREYNTRDNFSSTSSSNYAFCNRPRGGVSGRMVADPPSSIPLVVATTTISTPQNVVVSPDSFRTQPQKYVSKFKKSSEKVEDTILNTILLGKLNKFSEQNYDEIKEFITHIIDSGQTDMIKCFMKLVFEKAASEEMFCPLYAKLLSELSNRYPILLTEMANLYSQYMEIFDEVVEASAENYNEVCKRNVEKKYRRGYSQFLAELIKHDVIDTEIFMKTVNKIISQVELNSKSNEAIKLNEEFADCLMRIIRAIQAGVGSDNDESDEEGELKIEFIRTSLKTETLLRIKPLTMRSTEIKGMSNKARFTFLDIYDGIQKF